MNDSSRKSRSALDVTAVTLSGLCLLHCLALPFVVAGLPFLSTISGDHFHAEMLWIVLPISLVALGLGYHKHRSFLVWWIGAPGMLLLVIGGTVAHEMYGLAADRSFTLLGALVLAVAHFMNSRMASCSLTTDSQTA